MIPTYCFKKKRFKLAHSLRRFSPWYAGFKTETSQGENLTVQKCLMYGAWVAEQRNSVQENAQKTRCAKEHPSSHLHASHSHTWKCSTKPLGNYQANQLDMINFKQYTHPLSFWIPKHTSLNHT